MLTRKLIQLKPILESSSGIHISIYISGALDTERKRNEILNALHKVTDELEKNNVSRDTSYELLKPIESLVEKNSVLTSLPESFVIFRSPDHYRIVALPVEITSQVHVADTFHVKPMLKWLQQDPGFFLVHFDTKNAHVFRGDKTRLKNLDSIEIPKILTKKHRPGKSLTPEERKTQMETWDAICNWVCSLTETSDETVFVSGNPSLVSNFARQSPKRVAPVLWKKDGPTLSVQKALSEIRGRLHQETLQQIYSALELVEESKKMGKIETRLSKIGKAALQRRIRVLMISEDVQIHGRIDRKSGKVQVYSKDTDQFDDDLIDDIAQMVLAQGGDVIVRKKDEMPKQKPIVAVLDQRQSSPNSEKREKFAQTELSKDLHLLEQVG